MRVLFISFAVVGVLFMSLFGVKQWALMMPSQRFDHPFVSLDQPQPITVIQVHEPAEAKNILSEIPQAYFWLDLRITADGKFLLLRPELTQTTLTPEALGVEKWKGPQPSRYTEAELLILFPTAIRLQDFLVLFPETKMILNILDNVDGVHTQLMAAVEGRLPEQRFLFQSSADIILKSLKDKKPMWLYGSSQSDLMKILTFESLGLEATSPFRGDVLIAPMQISGRAAFNENVLTEILRRKKTIFLGPLINNREVEQAASFRPNGLIYSSLNLWRTTSAKVQSEAPTAVKIQKDPSDR